MGRLTDIANRQKTDKGTEHYEKHGYTEVYDRYIPETGHCKLLEIGIWHGDSLRMWINYIAKEAAPFNFIIDDGSHQGDHIVASFKLLWQHIKPGGYYFIEDLHAGHANRPVTIERIKRWLGESPNSMTLMANDKLLIIKKPWESPLS